MWVRRHSCSWISNKKDPRISKKEQTSKKDEGSPHAASAAANKNAKAPNNKVTVQRGNYSSKNQRDAGRAREQKATLDQTKTAVQLIEIGKKTLAAGRKKPTVRKRAVAADLSDEDSSDEEEAHAHAKNMSLFTAKVVHRPRVQEAAHRA